MVDDEAEILTSLTRILRAHDVRTVGSGAEARTLLAADRAFDLILCDVMMLDVTGMDLHEWLVAEDPDLARRLVFMTGGAFTPRARESLARVDVERIDKPFDVPELVQLVADVVRFRRRSRTD